MLLPHERHRQEQRLLRQLLQPSLVRVAGMLQAERLVACGRDVDERAHAELLREPLELAERCGALGEIHEVRLDAALGEETERLAGVGTLSRAEDLNVHGPKDERVQARRLVAPAIGTRRPRRAPRILGCTDYLHRHPHTIADDHAGRRANVLPRAAPAGMSDESYRPAWWVPGAHLRTLWGKFVRRPP